jgi:glutaminyl-peptide cyclotransferase
MDSSKHEAGMPKPSGKSILLVTALLITAVVVGYLLLFDSHDGLAGDPTHPASRLKLSDIPFNGARAYEYLGELCAIGPRPSGSAGMQTQQRLLEAHFVKLAGKVLWQEFRARDPRNGAPVKMANLIVQWHPERKKRILLCCHYDTRPFPDRDPQDPQGTFIGANDGASGTAILMELGAHMPELAGNLGVDFVLFDGEELVYGDNDPYFLGSEYFARNYAAQPQGYKYVWAVLLDMIGDTDLQIFQERHSAGWPDTVPLVNDIWSTAARLGVREFIPRKGYEIRDDHVKLHSLAAIPCCDLIDFDYPYWHTRGDTVDKCSALSLAKVGWVVEEWLKKAVKKP